MRVDEDCNLSPQVEAVVAKLNDALVSAVRTIAADDAPDDAIALFDLALVMTASFYQARGPLKGKQIKVIARRFADAMRRGAMLNFPTEH